MTASEPTFPLPEKQYRRYAIFWSMVMIGALLGALAVTVWGALEAALWQRAVVAGMLIAQGASYGLLIGQRLFPPERRLVAYFCLNLILWAIEIVLLPAVWWIVFAYIGQMYGMLRLRFALLLTLAAALVFFGQVTGWDLAGYDRQTLLAMVAQWISLTVFMVYVNHLIQASRERGRLIAELERTQRELEAARQRDAELAVLRERERLARDLHDSLGHTLVALSVQLEAVQRLYRVDPERASVQVDALKALTRESMVDLRRAVAGLRAPGLGERDLGPALQALCVELGGRAGVEVVCQIDEGVDAQGPAVAETVWRMAQEALTNVEKHAQARRVEVTLACEPDGLRLRVRDDGVGLPQDAETIPNRFGLRGMRERVEGLGGKLTLVGDEGGTTVEALLPIVGGRQGGQEA
jgi:signal transduction histidine kinase